MKKVYYGEKIENGFYETFLKELPVFGSFQPAVKVLGECLRAAKRAEMKVEKARGTYKTDTEVVNNYTHDIVISNKSGVKA